MVQIQSFLTSAMPRQTLYLWKQAPFIRLIIPVIAGIVLQWYCSPGVRTAWMLFFSGAAGMILFNLRISFLQYKLSWANGIFINGLFLSVGMLVIWHKDISHQPQWMNNYYTGKGYISITLEEPLSEKTNSFKANASVQVFVDGNNVQP